MKATTSDYFLIRMKYLQHEIQHFNNELWRSQLDNVQLFYIIIISNSPLNIMDFNSTLLSLKRVTVRRINVTEAKFITQIRYLPIHKLLILQYCTWSVAVWFQYSVKTWCAALPLSIVAWIFFLGNLPPSSFMRVHKPSIAISGGPWQRSCRPTKSQRYSMGEKSENSETRKLFVVLRRLLAESSQHVPGHCCTEIWNVQLAERGTLLQPLVSP